MRPDRIIVLEPAKRDLISEARIRSGVRLWGAELERLASDPSTVWTDLAIEVETRFTLAVLAEDRLDRQLRERARR